MSASQAKLVRFLAGFWVQIRNSRLSRTDGPDFSVCLHRKARGLPTLPGHEISKTTEATLGSGCAKGNP